MTFLNPWFLLGLLGAGVPVAIHLFQRQRLPKVSFPSVEFIREIEKRRVRRARLRQWLILVVRILAICFLALGLARPAGKGALGPGASTSAVIILDNSFSMGQRVDQETAFDRAKDKALEIVNLLHREDEATLILASDRPEISSRRMVSDPQLLREGVRAAELSYRSTDLLPSLREAYRLLGEAKNLNKEIYLLTDLQRCAFAGSSEDRRDFVDPSIRLFVVRCAGENPSNVSVEETRTSGSLLRPRSTAKIRAGVRDRGPGISRNTRTRVEMFIDDREGSTSQVGEDRAQSEECEFLTPMLEAGFHSGYVEIADDNLDADNRRYFVLDVPAMIRVLLMGSPNQSGTGTYYLEKALNPQGESEGFFDVQVSRDVGRSELGSFRLAVVAEPALVSSGDAALLERFVRNGGGLFVVAGGEADTLWLARQLLPRFLGPVSIGVWSLPAGKFLGLKAVRYDHPVFSEFTDPGRGDLSLVQFYRGLQLRGIKPTSVLARFGNGSPAVVETSVGQGRVIVFLGALNREWTGFPVRATFVPLIHRTTEYLASGTGQAEVEATVGSALEWELKGSSLHRVECLSPQGMALPLRTQARGDRLFVSVRETEIPGIYTLRQGSTIMGLKAVNLSLVESDLTPVTVADLSRLLSPAHPLFVSDGSSMREAVISLRFGREYTKVFLIAALLVLVVEMALWRL